LGAVRQDLPQEQEAHYSPEATTRKARVRPVRWRRRLRRPGLPPVGQGAFLGAQ
jgi:hypothetical protein